MSVDPGDDIGEETHDVYQVLVFVAGEGEALLNGDRSTVEENTMVVVPAGKWHNFINTGSTGMGHGRVSYDASRLITGNPPHACWLPYALCPKRRGISSGHPYKE